MKLIKPSFTILTEVKRLCTVKETRKQNVLILIVCSSDVFVELKQYSPFATGGNMLNFVIPHWSVIQPGEGTQSNFGLLPYPDVIWLNSMQNAEELYLRLCRSGISENEARCILPGSTQKNIIIGRSLASWKRILTRPEIRDEMKSIYEALKTLVDDAKIF